MAVAGEVGGLLDALAGVLRRLPRRDRGANDLGEFGWGSVSRLDMTASDLLQGPDYIDPFVSIRLIGKSRFCIWHQIMNEEMEQLVALSLIKIIQSNPPKVGFIDLA
ncbi:MAG TPA: hypothetical protein VHH12_10140 [Mycobacterium sp.]|nr:hypothetical protein [Mycobacterium sp.]